MSSYFLLLLDRKLAKNFCSKGIATYILNVVKDMMIEEEISLLAASDNSYVRGLAAVRSVINELLKDSQINGKFGILGMSMGGNLDGITADNQSNVWISDWMNGDIYKVSKSGFAQKVYNFSSGTADITFAKELNLLLVPQMNQSKVMAIQVE